MEDDLYYMNVRTNDYAIIEILRNIHKGEFNTSIVGQTNINK